MAYQATGLRRIEVQGGDYVGEDEIVRFADDFGRVPVNTIRHDA